MNNDDDEDNLDDENDDDGEKGLKRALNAFLALAHKAQPLRII